MESVERGAGLGLCQQSEDCSIGASSTLEGTRSALSTDGICHGPTPIRNNVRGPEIFIDIISEFSYPSNRDLSGIYHYEGSLTTPGCGELVKWIVMDTPLHIRRNGLVSDKKCLEIQEGNQTKSFTHLMQ